MTMFGSSIDADLLLLYRLAARQSYRSPSESKKYVVREVSMTKQACWQESRVLWHDCRQTAEWLGIICGPIWIVVATGDSPRRPPPRCADISLLTFNTFRTDIGHCPQHARSFLQGSCQAATCQ